MPSGSFYASTCIDKRGRVVSTKATGRVAVCRSSACTIGDTVHPCAR
eukprot:IDg7598t1